MALLRVTQQLRWDELHEHPSVAVDPERFPIPCYIALPGDVDPNEHIGERNALLYITKRYELIYTTRDGQRLVAHAYVAPSDHVLAFEDVTRDMADKTHRVRIQETEMLQFIRDTK